MQFYYEDKMPLRVLDEIEFWKQQEAEHTIVIQELVPNLEEEFRTSLQEWEQVLSRTHARSKRYIETLNRIGNCVDDEIRQKIMKLVGYSLDESRKFIFLVNNIATQSSVVRQNRTAIVVLNHIRRESEYFIGIAQTLLS
jgi:Domain of unknown function (DUF2935)